MVGGLRSLCLYGRDKNDAYEHNIINIKRVRTKGDMYKMEVEGSNNYVLQNGLVIYNN